MKTTIARSLILFSFLVWDAPAEAQASHVSAITAAEAKEHLGEKRTVCGKVASSHYADDIRGKPTFMDLDSPFPDQIFTIVIRGADRAKFGEPESTYRGKSVCVTGKLKELLGVPVVIASEPAQIKLKD